MIKFVHGREWGGVGRACLVIPAGPCAHLLLSGWERTRCFMLEPGVRWWRAVPLALVHLLDISGLRGACHPLRDTGVCIAEVQGSYHMCLRN